MKTEYGDLYNSRKRSIEKLVNISTRNQTNQNSNGGQNPKGSTIFPSGIIYKKKPQNLRGNSIGGPKNQHYTDRSFNHSVIDKTNFMNSLRNDANPVNTQSGCIENPQKSGNVNGDGRGEHGYISHKEMINIQNLAPANNPENFYLSRGRFDRGLSERDRPVGADIGNLFYPEKGNINKQILSRKLKHKIAQTYSILNNPSIMAPANGPPNPAKNSAKNRSYIIKEDGYWPSNQPPIQTSTRQDRSPSKPRITDPIPKPPPPTKPIPDLSSKIYPTRLLPNDSPDLPPKIHPSDLITLHTLHPHKPSGLTKKCLHPKTLTVYTIKELQIFDSNINELIKNFLVNWYKNCPIDPYLTNINNLIYNYPEGFVSIVCQNICGPN
jgi:hypothetical protein